MRQTDLNIFEVPGCGRVIADLTRDDLAPVIQFEDGKQCFGLPRKFEEVMPMGYESIAEGNFIHEALHMFVAHKCGFTSDSILHRAARGEDIDGNPEYLREAMDEERIVLGLQIAVNETEGDGQTTNKVGGFLLHIAAAAREFARVSMKEKYGCDLDEIKAEFLDQLQASGCLYRALGRKPELQLREAEVGERVKINADYREGHGRIGFVTEIDRSEDWTADTFSLTHKVEDAYGNPIGWYKAEQLQRVPAGESMEVKA